MFHHQKGSKAKKMAVVLSVTACAFILASESSYAQPQGIRVVDASYGLNCGAVKGNATADIAYSCNGKSSCKYNVNHRRIGDPAVGCGKNYIVTWLCPGTSRKFQTVLPPEASGGTITLTCEQGQASTTIRVKSATYGGNCGAPRGNATRELETQCNGRESCNYMIDHRAIGDPVVGCKKTYKYEYMCGTSPRQGSVSAEASGKSAKLSCQ